jgi:phage protein U
MERGKDKSDNTTEPHQSVKRHQKKRWSKERNMNRRMEKERGKDI